MSSIGRSCERGVEGIVNFIDGINQRLDENHIVDMIINLKDEEITVDEFQDFTKVVKELRSGKSAKSAKATTTATNA